MILYSGHKSDKHEYGTGFYISRHNMDNLLDFEPIHKRICKIRGKLKYYTIITPTKCTRLLLKAPDITICTFLSYILPLHVLAGWCVT
jgi:hypothetical protein